jgi:hypothetical protein
MAKVYALTANRHAARPGDQHLDLIPPLTAETALRVAAIHGRPLLITIGHHYQPRRMDNSDYAGKRPAYADLNTKARMPIRTDGLARSGLMAWFCRRARPSIGRAADHRVQFTRQ